MTRPPWTPALAYHPQPDGLTVRPRLAVISSAGIVWVGKESAEAWRAARKLAEWLNRRSREGERRFDKGALLPTVRVGRNRRGRGRGRS